MKLTALGKELRKIRLDGDEVLFDMAKKLNISSAMLSSIEIGRKSAPDDFIERISKQYPEVANRRAEFDLLADLTKKSMKVSLDVSDEAKELAYAFRRELPTMTPELLREFKNLLETKIGSANAAKDKGSNM